MKFSKRAIISSADELPSGAPLAAPTLSSPALSWARVARSPPSSATSSFGNAPLYSSTNSSATSFSSLDSASSLSSSSTSSSSSSLSSSSPSPSTSFSSLSPTASLFTTPSSSPSTPPTSPSRNFDSSWRTNVSPRPSFSIVVGGIYRIPEQHRVDPSSIIHSSLASNAGPFNHPFVVVREQGGIATVLCITSQEQTALKHPDQHVAIGSTYYNLPGVMLAKGAMEKQSFVQTTGAYQIECANLKPFHRTGGTVPQIDTGSIEPLVDMVAAWGRRRLLKT